MILSCSHIEKEFVTGPVVKDCSFHIEDKEKVAIVGINGAGKTTLLRMLIGQLSPDSGTVTLSKDATIGYLSQHQDLTSHLTIYAEMESAMAEIIAMEERIRQMESEMTPLSGNALEELMQSYSRLTHRFELENGYAYKSEIAGVLKGLGFPEADWTKEISQLSGGQKTRVALGKLLLSKPSLIILDEPTNHLDITSVSWLEGFLSNYNGAVLIVSHDRYFLDKIVTKVIEIDQTKVSVFSGNYSAYADKKAMLREAAMKAWLNQQQEIKHQEAVITKLKQFNREKSIKRAESREKMLDKVERLERPSEAKSEMRIELVPNILSGKDVLTVEGIEKSFDTQTLFSDLSFDIKRGERVAIIGDNGTGKTTILKMITGLLPPDAGVITLGSQVYIGYYDQEQQVLDPNKTLFDEISDAYPELTNTKIRNMLAAFLFTNDDVYKYIRDLSGGERGRVSLAKLMLSKANFLILDEPTNHLDMVSKEILERAVSNYTGTVLYVSHDRYFINKTATRILELKGKALTVYRGNYDYYMEKCAQPNPTNDWSTSGTAAFGSTASSQSSAPSASKEDWKAKKEAQALQRKKENQIAKIEKEIAELEEEEAMLAESYNDPAIATNVSKLQEISKKQAEITNRLETLYDTWTTLSES
jgi:ATP-binding cassette subfamily F protein 3